MSNCTAVVVLGFEISPRIDEDDDETLTWAELEWKFDMKDENGEYFLFPSYSPPPKRPLRKSLQDDTKPSTDRELPVGIKIWQSNYSPWTDEDDPKFVVGFRVLWHSWENTGIETVSLEQIGDQRNELHQLRMALGEFNKPIKLFFQHMNDT